MGSSSLKVYLTNYTGRYVPGDTITGKVRVVLSEPQLVYGVSVRIKGTAKVRWNRKQDGEEFFHRHVYLMEEFYLAGNADEEMQMEAGQHAFPFAFRLPFRIPNTFEAVHGSVKYKLKGTLETGRTDPLIHQISFKIDAPLTYKMDESRVINHRIEQDFECCIMPWFPTPRMHAQVRLARTAFSVGETVEMFVDVKLNSLCLSIASVAMRIVELVHFMTPEENLTKVKYLEERFMHGPFDSFRDVRLALKIPECRHSALFHCKLITIQHKVGVSFYVEGQDAVERYYDIRIGQLPGQVDPRPRTVVPDLDETAVIELRAPNHDSPPGSREPQRASSSVLDSSRADSPSPSYELIGE